MKRAWRPDDGPVAAPEQLPPAGQSYAGDGHTDRASGGLWAPSQGPTRHDPGGPGGEPDGKTISIPGRTALNER